MIVRPPSLDLPKWLVAISVASVGHWLFVWALADKSSPVETPITMSTVMLEFADLPQSATKIEPISIGKPQEVMQESVASASEAPPEVPSEPAKIVVDESPEPAEIVVKKQPKQTPKPKSKPQESAKVTPKKPPQKVVKKQTETAEKKHKPTPEKQVKDNASTVNAHTTSYTLSAPPKGDERKNTASSDNVSESRNRLQNWQSQVLGRLNRYLRYPPFALENGIEGTVLTAIQIDRNGNVLNVTIRKSSGASSLDNEAIAVAKRASPLPAPPDNVRNLVLPIPIRFNVKEFKKAQGR